MNGHSYYSRYSKRKSEKGCIRVKVICVLQTAQWKWLKQMRSFRFLSCKIDQKRYPGLKLYQNYPGPVFVFLWGFFGCFCLSFAIFNVSSILKVQWSCGAPIWHFFRGHPWSLWLLTFIYSSWATPSTKEATKWRFLAGLTTNNTDILLWQERGRLDTGQNTYRHYVHIIEMHITRGKQKVPNLMKTVHQGSCCSRDRNLTLPTWLWGSQESWIVPSPLCN